jgi:hypothetical protein
VLRRPDWHYLAEVDGFMQDPGPYPEIIARYVNHHFDPARRNVEYYREGAKYFVRTTRAVAAGEEFFADYGERYWALIDEPERNDWPARRFAARIVVRTSPR